MAFDRNEPADLLALKNEVELDPVGVGYTPADGDTGKLLGLLNTPASNPGGEIGPDFLTTANFLSIVYVENVSAGDQFRIQLLFEMTEGDVNIDKYRGDIALLNDAGLNARIALIVRPLTRAEVLFSDVVDGAKESVVITDRDWFAARV